MSQHQGKRSRTMRDSALGVRPPGLSNSLGDTKLGPLLSGASVHFCVKSRNWTRNDLSFSSDTDIL